MKFDTDNVMDITFKPYEITNPRGWAIILAAIRMIAPYKVNE